MDGIIEEAQALAGDGFPIDLNIHRFRQRFDCNGTRKDKNTPLKTVAVAKSVKEDEASRDKKSDDDGPKNGGPVSREQHGFNLAQVAAPQQARRFSGVFGW